jgi:purine-nucleoside/S-methyl-5'-thioadenosine phosphorylase / adenosine deaminase
VRLIEADWPAAADGVIAGTTTRSGGVSEGAYRSLNLGAHVGDSAAAVWENRRRLATGLQLPEQPRWLNQVHATRVVRAGSPAFADGPPDADAIVCHRGRAALGILTADCLPILLCDTGSRGIAALHCGWRSLAAGIVDAGVARLQVDPAGLLAWLGPAISRAAFEVGDEVRDRFLAGIEGAAACFEPNAHGRWQADLYALARLYLARAGVTRVYGGGLCTFGDPERFFSYRRDGQCGRMATVIFRRDA